MDFVPGSSASSARRAQAPSTRTPAVTYTTMATGRNAPKRSYADHDTSQASMSLYAAQTSDQARSGSSMASSSVLNPHRHHPSRTISDTVEDLLEMNNDAQPARPKRRTVPLGLGPLSPGPSMPAGGSLRTNPLTSTSTSNSMAHVDHDPALWTSQSNRQQVESTDAARASNAQSSLGTARDSLSRILSRSLLDFEDSFEPTPDYRSNRMSWFPDDAAANNTITTNTEPGWNLTAPLQEYAPDASSSSRPLPSRSLTLDTNGANQPYSSSFLTSEASQPMERMTNPGANLANTQAQESQLFYSQSDSDGSIPSPMEWALHEVRSQPAQANTNTSTNTPAGSWWPTQWSYSASRNPTVSAPMSSAATQRGLQEVPEVSTYHRPAATNAGEGPDQTPLPRPRHSANAEWDPFAGSVDNDYLPSPHYWSLSQVHSSSQSASAQSAVPPSPWEFPEPQIYHEPAPAPTISSTLPRSRFGQGGSSVSHQPTEYSTSESWDPNPTSRPQLWDLPALPPVPPPQPTVSNAQARSVRFQEDAAPRRLHSPPPPQTSSGSRLSSIQSLLDRCTRRTSGVGEGSRAGLSHSRSASEGSRNMAHSSVSGTSGNRDVRNRRAERVESWVETSRPSGMPAHRPETMEPLDPFPTTNGSFYDHPSMRDIVSSHSEVRGSRQGRERNSSGFYDHSIIPSPIGPSQEDLGAPIEYLQPARSRAQRPPPSRLTWTTLRPQTPNTYTEETTTFYGSLLPRWPDSPPVAPRDPFDWSADAPPWPRPRRDESPDQGRSVATWFGLEDEVLVVPSVSLEEEPIPPAPSRRSIARGRRSRPLRTVTLSHVTHRMRVMGDYVLDDEFDDSYEALMALTQHIGPVKRGCSQQSLEELPSGTYKEFSEGANEKVVGDNGNCAICLEDYQPEDACIKLPRCSHFYHKDCVKEWLKSAKTCPVCRETVEGPPRSESSPARRPSFLSRRGPRETMAPRLWDESATAQPGPSTVTPRRSAARRRMAEDISAEQGADFARQSRRDRAPRRISRPPPTLGEYDDPWPGFSPPSPDPFSIHSGPTMATHTTTTETSARFIRGPLAHALRETSDLRLRY